MEISEGTVLFATAEGGFDLAAHFLANGVAQEEFVAGLDVGRHVERLVGVHAGQRAGGDVPHRVTAGFAGRHAGRSQVFPHPDGVVQLNVVHLHVLPRGDVQPAVGVLLGHIRQRDQLVRRQVTERDLSAEHMDTVLTLAVDAAGQAVVLETVLVFLQAVVRDDAITEFLDVGRNRCG